MRRLAWCICLLLLVCFIVSGAQPRSGDAGSSNGGGHKVLDFQTMVGVSGPYRGATNAIRGVQGAGAAWVISDAAGKLRTDGRIDIVVEGLVLASTGLNPVPEFKAIVSCLSIDEDGLPVTVNLETGLFPADAAGNCLIDDNVELPDPCLAPIVFVSNAAGRWFAVTGF